MKCLAPLLLLAGAQKVLAWEHAGAVEAQVWNITSSLLSVVLLLVIWRQNAGAVVSAVIGWLLIEEAAVIGCNAWFIAEPFAVRQGVDMCSAGAGFHIGTLSLIVLFAAIGRVSCEARHER